ncbi:MAG: hypothetical protein R2818_05765 [Flavobacteriales bacterium]
MLSWRRSVTWRARGRTTGDGIAIVWKDARLTRKQRSKAIKESFTRNDVPIDLVADATEHARLFADFNGGGRWYRAAEVDALSKEEAGVMLQEHRGAIAGREAPRP